MPAPTLPLRVATAVAAVAAGFLMCAATAGPALAASAPAAAPTAGQLVVVLADHVGPNHRAEQTRVPTAPATALTIPPEKLSNHQPA